MSYGYGGGGGRRGRRGGRGHRDGSRERWDGGGSSRGHSSDCDQDRGGGQRDRPPPHLKGREIGLWYARYGAVKRKQDDRRSVWLVLGYLLFGVVFGKVCLQGVRNRSDQVRPGVSFLFKELFTLLENRLDLFCNVTSINCVFGSDSEQDFCMYPLISGPGDEIS